jgi:hypothetical protein
MRMTVTFAVRGQERATLERRTKRLRQRAKDLGAELRLTRRGAARRLAGGGSITPATSHSPWPVGRDRHGRKNVPVLGRHPRH